MSLMQMYGQQQKEANEKFVVYQLKKKFSDKLIRIFNKDEEDDECIVLKEQYLICDNIICVSYDSVPTAEQVKELIKVGDNKCVGIYIGDDEPEYFVFKRMHSKCRIDEYLDTYYVRIDNRMEHDTEIMMLAFMLGNNLSREDTEYIVEHAYDDPELGKKYDQLYEDYYLEYTS